MDIIDTQDMQFKLKAISWLIEEVKKVKNVKYLRLCLKYFPGLKPADADKLTTALITSLQDSVWQSLEVCELSLFAEPLNYVVNRIALCDKLQTLILQVEDMPAPKIVEEFARKMPTRASLALGHWGNQSLADIKKFKSNITTDGKDLFDKIFGEQQADSKGFAPCNFNLPQLTKLNPSHPYEEYFEQQKKMFHCTKFEGLTNYQVLLSTIKVAVLDSGIDTTHPDFKILQERKFLTGESSAKLSWKNDTNGHGTMCAGLIGGAATGIAHGVKLHIIRVVGVRSATSLALADGIRKAIAQNVQIISISLGRKKYIQEVHDAIQQAISSNIVVVCAVGNGGSLLRQNITFPATIASVIRVGSIDSSGAASNFSAVGGPEVDIAALGEKIASTVPMQLGKYALMNGTSFAAPLVAGLCALLMCYEMSLVPSPAERVLVNSHCMKHLLRELCYNTSGEAAKGRGTANLEKILAVPQLFEHELSNIC